MDRPPPGPDWVAIDVETTGFAPDTDRVVEIGVVRWDAWGREIGAWATILDPGRDPGPTHVHGIAPEDVAGAPRFADVTGELLARLGGARLIAHNATFDAGFLVAELGRARVDWRGMEIACSMQAARHAGIGPKATLAACCTALGIRNPAAHSALADARAAGEVLLALLPRLDGYRGIAVRPAPPAPWPARLVVPRQRG